MIKLRSTEGSGVVSILQSNAAHREAHRRTCRRAVGIDGEVLVDAAVGCGAGANDRVGAAVTGDDDALANVQVAIVGEVFGRIDASLSDRNCGAVQRGGEIDGVRSRIV